MLKAILNKDAVLVAPIAGTGGMAIAGFVISLVAFVLSVAALAVGVVALVKVIQQNKVLEQLEVVIDAVKADGSANLPEVAGVDTKGEDEGEKDEEAEEGETTDTVDTSVSRLEETILSQTRIIEALTSANASLTASVSAIADITNTVANIETNMTQKQPSSPKHIAIEEQSAEQKLATIRNIVTR